MAVWKEYKIGDLCDTISETYRGHDEEVILINTSDVLEGRILNHQKVPNRNVKGQFKKTFKTQDILYSEIRPENNRFAYVDMKDTSLYIASTKLMVIRANIEIIEPRFLYAILTAKSMTQELQVRAELRSGTFPQITFKTELATIKVCVPDRKTQKKIVSFLDAINRKIEVNNKINRNLSEQMQAIFGSIFYSEMEKGNKASLGDYLYIKGRIGWKGLKKEEYLSESEYRIINGESLTVTGIDWNKAGYISEERYIESPEIMLQEGDILISKDGTIGKIGYVNKLDKPTSVASGIFVVRNLKPEEVSTVFIYCLLNSDYFKSFIASRTEGSVIPHLYQKDFVTLEIPILSQEQIVLFNSTVVPLFELFFSNQTENIRLAALRDSLLPKLMSGELDVLDLDI